MEVAYLFIIAVLLTALVLQMNSNKKLESENLRLKALSDETLRNVNDFATAARESEKRAEAIARRVGQSRRRVEESRRKSD